MASAEPDRLAEQRRQLRRRRPAPSNWATDGGSAIITPMHADDQREGPDARADRDRAQHVRAEMAGQHRHPRHSRRWRKAGRRSAARRDAMSRQARPRCWSCPALAQAWRRPFWLLLPIRSAKRGVMRASECARQSDQVRRITRGCHRFAGRCRRSTAPPPTPRRARPSGRAAGSPPRRTPPIAGRRSRRRPPPRRDGRGGSA